MKHLQLYRNSTFFNSRSDALNKWQDADFINGLSDGEFIAARYKDGDEIHVMTGHYVASIAKVVVHDLTQLEKRIDAIDGAISGDLTDFINKIDVVSGSVTTLQQEVIENEAFATQSISSINDSCGFSELKYVQGPDYISGATSVTDALNILSTSLKNKVSYDALKHSITIDGNEQVLNVGQLLTDMSYDASTNILTLYYKDENDGSGNTAVNIDMTQLVTDAVNTAVTNAELTFSKDDTHNVTFTKTGNTVMADVDIYDCGEY